MGTQSPQYRRQQAYVTLHSRAGWSRLSHSLGTGSGASRGAACLLIQPEPASQSQAGPQQPRSERNQKTATCTHTHMQLTCVKHAHMCPNYHSCRTLAHCTPTGRTIHIPQACTHVQKHLYVPLYVYSGVGSHMSTLCHTHLQPQGPTATDSCLPKTILGAECRPAISHTHGHLLETGTDPGSHNS